MNKRVPAEKFDIPLSEIRIGWRSATYFDRARCVVKNEIPDKEVLMQVFQKQNAVLCGVDEAVAVLRLCSGSWIDYETAKQKFDRYQHHRWTARKYRSQGEPLKAGEHSRVAYEFEEEMHRLWKPGFDELAVKALSDGDSISPWETVLTIGGPYHLFAHLESVYLGILARSTRVATNVRRVAEAANGKPLLFFADRFDRASNLGSDGYAAHIGGASGVASGAMASWYGEEAIGTVPHALIAAFNGDTVEALGAFQRNVPGVDLVALVDFDNNCVQTTLECVAAFGAELKAVRLDTSETMVDRSITQSQMGQHKPTGVNPVLVMNVRAALDRRGYDHVQIIVSGGFDAEKIAAFEKMHVPVDAYAVGESLLKGSTPFTADIVLPVSKAGRWPRPNVRLETVGNDLTA